MMGRRRVLSALGRAEGGHEGTFLVGVASAC